MGISLIIRAYTHNYEIRTTEWKKMRAITVKSLQTQAHPQTRMMFWFLFGSSKGSNTRRRIVNLLKTQPSNTHQISKDLQMDYKSIKHHLATMEKNQILGKFDAVYGGVYFLAPLFEENNDVFDEIENKIGSDKSN